MIGANSDCGFDFEGFAIKEQHGKSVLLEVPSRRTVSKSEKKVEPQLHTFFIISS